MSPVFAFWPISDSAGNRLGVHDHGRGLIVLLYLLTALVGRAQIAVLPAPSDKSEGVPAHPTLTWSYSETNLLSNGGFEDGTNGWSIGSAQRANQSLNISAAEGSFLLLGVGGMVQRDLVLPLGHGGLRLAYKVLGSFVTPNLTLELTDEPGPPLSLPTVPSLGNEWQTYGADLSAFAGRSVRLTWRFISNDNVRWGLDDVRLTPVPMGTEFEVWFSTNEVSQLTQLGRTSVPAWPLRFLPPDRRFFWRVDTIQGGQTNLGSVWQFRSKRFLILSQLLVDPLPPVLCAQQTVMLGLQLADESGFPGPSSNSSRKVWPVVEAIAEDRPPPPVVVTELSLMNETLEFQNLSAQSLDLSGWMVDALQGSPATATNVVRITLPPGSILEPGARFDLQMNRISLSAWPRLTTPRSANWFLSRRAGVILRQPGGTVVDCVFYDQNGRVPSPGDPRPGQTRTVGIGQWRGAAVTNAIPAGWTLQRAGNRDLNSASDWVFAPNSLFGPNPNLVTPFVPGFGPIPVTVPTNSLTTDSNGYFTLPVQFAAPVSNVVLYATASLFPTNLLSYSGKSEPFSLANEICLTVEFPPSVSEMAGTLSGALRVRILVPRDTNVVVRLRSPDAAGEGITIPAEILIPAGATEAMGDLTLTDNVELTGPRQVNVRGEAVGYAPTQLVIRINDDETTTLRLVLPSVIPELSQTFGTLFMDPPLDRPISLRLLSSDPNRLRLAAVSSGTDSVTVEPGTREIPIAAVAIDNPHLEGPVPLTVLAGFADWTSVQVDVEIADNEANTLTVQWLGSESLREGQPATSFQVLLGGLVTNSVSLAVAFDPPGRIHPAPELVIPPGISSITLPLQAVDDELKNGRTLVTVRISAPGWQDAAFTLPVLDNEPVRFRVQLPPGPLPLDQPFMITALPESVDGLALPNLWLPDVQITARDAGGPAFGTQVGPTFVNGEGMQIPVTLTQGGGAVRFLVEANSPVGLVVGESVPVAVWNVPTALNLSSLVFDEPRNRLLAISPQQPLVALDLTTGARRPLTPALPGVAQAVWAGGDTLYASWMENRELARIHLPSFEPGVTWPVGTLSSGIPRSLRHFLPLPGQPDSLIVGREGVPGTELAVFDGTNARPLIARFDSEQALSLLYGQSPGQVFAVTPDRVEEFAVSPEGIQRVTKLWSLRLNYDRNARPGDSVISQGQVLTGQGELLDPNLPGRLGNNSADFRPNAFATDPHTGRLAWYQSDWDGQVVFRVFDPLTLREVWRRTRLDKPSQYPGSLVSAGPHRWAVLVNGQLQLETDEAPDPAPATDLAIRVASVTRQPATSSAVVQWRIENRGTNPAPDVRLMVAFPEARDRGPAALLITAMSTNAVPGTNGLGGTNYLLGDLAPGASVEVTADLRAALNGRLDAAAWVGSAAADPDPSNNRAAVTAEGLDPQLTLSISSPDAEQLLRVEFPTRPGWNYHLDYALTPNGTWEGAAGYRGTGQPISLTLPSRDSATRFWRLSISDP
ncbi:MAG: lamin tail domain-containing protein [Verrucomicrobia bacterium]|nr:lamin tail domain-containing protein [Verrucomicrobiota bacterium]